MINKTIADFRAGDILERPKGFFTHKGIYLGSARVAHITSERGAYISSIEDFADGNKVTPTRIPDNRRQMVLANAYNAVRQRRAYDLITYNCEHFITEITEGRKYSTQLWLAGTVAVIGIAFALSRG